MPNQIQTEHFTKAFYALLGEAFDNVHGFYLDKDTFLFRTLDSITARRQSHLG